MDTTKPKIPQICLSDEHAAWSLRIDDCLSTISFQVSGFDGTEDEELREGWDVVERALLLGASGLQSLLT